MRAYGVRCSKKPAYAEEKFSPLPEPAFAIAPPFGETSRAMAHRAPRRQVLVRLVAAAVLLPVVAGAQVPFEAGGGDAARSSTRLRDRYRSPQNNQKLDDNVRKLRSDDPEKRLEGLKGFGEMNEPRAIEYLVAAANDPDMRIRIKAIDILGNIKATDATPLLIQQLFMRDTDLGTKQRILACLGKIGDERATKPILDFLARDVDPAVQGNAIFALGDIGDPTAVPSLEAIARNGHDERLRALAQDSIRKIRAKPEPPVVPPALAGDGRTPPGRATP
jgi:HEAT repeat protein